MKTYYDKDLPQPLAQDAFKPSSEDTDGISLVRKNHTTSPTDALASTKPENRHKYHVVELPVTLFSTLGLTVIATPNDECIGHASVDELNITAYKGKDKSLKGSLVVKMAELAKYVKPEHVVFSSPDEDSPT